MRFATFVLDFFQAFHIHMRILRLNGAAAFFGASVAWTTSFLIAAHHQKKMALSANINMLNDNITNRKALGIGFNFSF